MNDTCRGIDVYRGWLTTRKGEVGCEEQISIFRLQYEFRAKKLDSTVVANQALSRDDSGKEEGTNPEPSQSHLDRTEIRVLVCKLLWTDCGREVVCGGADSDRNPWIMTAQSMGKLLWWILLLLGVSGL